MRPDRGDGGRENRLSLFLPLRWALREVRGGLAGFRVLLASLALGVAAIAGIGSVAASIDAGLAADAEALLGGDVELHLVHRTATADELAFLTECDLRFGQPFAGSPAADDL